ARRAAASIADRGDDQVDLLDHLQEDRLRRRPGHVRLRPASDVGQAIALLQRGGHPIEEQVAVALAVCQQADDLAIEALEPRRQSGDDRVGLDGRVERAEAGRLDGGYGGSPETRMGGRATKSPARPFASFLYRASAGAAPT